MALPIDPAASETREWVGWVEAAQGGDRGAFARLYDRFQPVVRSLALARLSPDVADDVVHDVFVRALGKLGTLRDPQAFPGWLTALARHRVTDTARRKTASLDEVPEASVSNSELLEARRILRVLQSLPEAYAEPLCMRLVEGMTGPEIAERTGMTPGSVRVNLCRGMKLLRDALKERGLP